jgi:uncharacterized protein (DUF4415 family)
MRRRRQEPSSGQAASSVRTDREIRVLNPACFCYECAMSRRPSDPRAAAERAFKAVTGPKPAEVPPKPQSPPGLKEMVTLRIDRDVLDFFQEGGPGWQERINAALRKAAGK